MATGLDYIEYVCGQIRGGHEVRYKKMFGEYMVYINGKPLLLVCDNCVFVKMLDCLKEIMANAETGFPYSGAKLHYILDIENAELTDKVIEVLLGLQK